MYQEGRGGDKALASDGRFLYIHTHCGLFKMGTGYGETIEGFIYASKPDFFLNKIGWLGYAQVILPILQLLLACIMYSYVLCLLINCPG